MCPCLYYSRNGYPLGPVLFDLPSGGSFPVVSVVRNHAYHSLFWRIIMIITDIRCLNRDTLLLEAGILGILAAPWLPTIGGMGNKPRDLTTMWMVKWLLFRLMFASGVVKLQSGCPTWWGLTGKRF